MIAVMQAAVDGKAIEWRPLRLCHLPEWRPLDVDRALWAWDTNDYRIKPEPEPRKVPCGPEDFPPGTAIKYLRKSQQLWSIVSEVWATRVRSIGVFYEYRCQVFMEQYQRSLDGGKTWLPCYKEVTQ